MADPVFDNTQATEEGWSIFDCAGSDNGRWQLQKCDDAETFRTDMEAWVFVRDMPEASSPYHTMAMLFLETHNPVEWRLINDWGRQRAMA
jgi:hypothetical protein